MIAALFVETDGVYFGLDGVDPYDKDRDATTYAGHHAIIAHPPCQLWGNMALVNYKRWGGEHNRPGNDGGTFQKALEFVNTYGGVLEHPAKSRAWASFGLSKPVPYGWSRSGDGFVCEVWQSAYGHKANKATWLYYRGKKRPFDLNWSRPVAAFQIGFHDQRGKENNKPTLSKKEANATPVAFRDELIRLAKYSKQPIDESDSTAPRACFAQGEEPTGRVCPGSNCGATTPESLGGAEFNGGKA